MRLANLVKFRQEKFGGVLFETRSEKSPTLSPVATAAVWEIEAARDPQEIVTRLKKRFQDRDGVIERETHAFIAEPGQKGLVQD